MPRNQCPPGPRGSFLFGNLAEFRRDHLNFLTRSAREFGDMVSLRFGLKRVILVSHPDLIDTVLVTDSRNYIKHYITRLLRPTLGNGLLISEGDFWLRQRRLMQPAFHKNRIHSYGDTMVAYAQRMSERWQSGETRNLHKDMSRLTLEIVAKALFDADVAGKASDVGEALETGMENFLRRWHSLYPIPSWLPTPSNLRARRAIRRLDDIIFGFIRQRRASGVDQGDLLSMLLRAQDEADGSGMTDRQLRDEAMTLFLAGHETTANALAWTWYLLAQHPAVETRVLAELDLVLQGRLPTVSDLPHFHFTEMVVTESMRLYPPVYAFGRETLRPCVLGDFQLPKGMTIMMSQWVLHRDPRFFDNPDEFRPERWADGLAKRLPKFAYFPFGGGPRVCIGNTFAMMETILVLATMLPRVCFTLAPDQPVIPLPTVTLRPQHGIHGVVTKRQSESTAAART